MTFTDKKPTVPGAYWWRRTEKHPSLLVTVHFCDSFRCSDLECLGITDMRGLWSSRLVPADESEAYQEGYQHAFDEIVHSRARRVPVEEVKEAYHEGVGSGASAGRPLYVGKLWSASRARRVVEGKEGV